MELMKEQVVDYAVEVVNDLNAIIQGMELNDKVCAAKGSKYELKDCFLARAKDLIFSATRKQLEDAYDECMEGDVIEEQGHGQLDKIVGEMFKIVGNKAPNPDNEKLIETIWFGYV